LTSFGATTRYVDEEPHLLIALENLIHASAGAWHRAKRGRYRDDIAIAVAKLGIS